MTHTDCINALNNEKTLSKNVRAYGAIRDYVMGDIPEDVLMAILYQHHNQNPNPLILKPFVRELAIFKVDPQIPEAVLEECSKCYDDCMHFLFSLIHSYYGHSYTAGKLLAKLFGEGYGKTALCVNTWGAFEIAQLLDQGFRCTLWDNNSRQAACIMMIAEMDGWAVSMVPAEEPIAGHFDTIFYRDNHTEAEAHQQVPDIIRDLAANNLKETGQMVVWSDGHNAKSVGDDWYRLRKGLIEHHWLDLAFSLPESYLENNYEYELYTIWCIDKRGVEHTTYYDTQVDFGLGKSPVCFYDFDVDKFAQELQSVESKYRYTLTLDYLKEHDYRIMSPPDEFAQRNWPNQRKVMLGDILEAIEPQYKDCEDSELPIPRFYTLYTDCSNEMVKECICFQHYPSYPYISQAAFGVKFSNTEVMVAKVDPASRPWCNKTTMFIPHNSLFFNIKPTKNPDDHDNAKSYLDSRIHVDSKYLLRCFRQKEFWRQCSQCYSYEDTVGIYERSWTWKDFQEMYIPLPLLKEQQALVANDMEYETNRVIASMVEQMPGSFSLTDVISGVHNTIQKERGDLLDATISIAPYRCDEDRAGLGNAGEYSIYIQKKNGEQIHVRINNVESRLLYVFLAKIKFDSQKQKGLKSTISRTELEGRTRDFYALYSTLFGDVKDIVKLIQPLHQILPICYQSNNNTIENNNFDAVKSRANTAVKNAVDSQSEVQAFLIKTLKGEMGIECTCNFPEEFINTFDGQSKHYDSEKMQDKRKLINKAVFSVEGSKLFK